MAIFFLGGPEILRLGGSSSFRGPYFQGLQLGIPIVGFSYGDSVVIGCRGWSIDVRDVPSYGPLKDTWLAPRFMFASITHRSFPGERGVFLTSCGPSFSHRFSDPQFLTLGIRTSV
jgi:hypothetical protein